MRKRRVRIRIKRYKSATGRRAMQPVRPKAARSGAIGECRTYVTETHYEL